jgi:hypothetical protein
VPIRGHRERTAKIDAPQIAKTWRISKEHEEFVRPRDECPPKESRWPKREFQKRKLSVRRIVNIVWWVVVTVAFLLAVPPARR